jgi:hypothetical protein
VKRCPLEDWGAMADWRPPRPPAFDEAKRQALADARAKGELAICSVEHGFFLMRLYYLRGFENLMLDIATDEPRLHELIRILTNYNSAAVKNYLAAGAEMMILAEDLGMQT